MAKSKEEIASWLKEQFWYDKWRKNLEQCLKKHDYPEIAIQFFVEGRASEFSIKGAFDWSATPEGEFFWTVVDEYFKLWCNFDDNVK